MEGPMYSSVNKNNNNINHIVTEDYVYDEESGWTAYLEDFSSCANNNVSLISSSSPSLVSDAAWYGSDNNMIISHQVKKLSFIKNLKRSSGSSTNQRRRYSCHDDLEDTASSPVNSPKVSTLKQMEMINYRRLDDVTAAGKLLGKQAVSITKFSEHERKPEIML